VLEIFFLFLPAAIAFYTSHPWLATNFTVTRKVIVVGGDIPDIKPRLIFDALTALDHVDMVRVEILFGNCGLFATDDWPC
jgi:hypothetical protein